MATIESMRASLLNDFSRSNNPFYAKEWAAFDKLVGSEDFESLWGGVDGIRNVRRSISDLMEVSNSERLLSYFNGDKKQLIDVLKRTAGVEGLNSEDIKSTRHC